MTDLASARFALWIAALDTRHLASLTPAEVTRALRALSSCYVERRGKLAQGGALATAGKRAAFALFYAPVHFLLTHHIVRSQPIAQIPLAEIHDLGCGTGAAGAAWALTVSGARLAGADRHPWAVAEANWTYRQLRIDGRAVQADLARVTLPGRRGAGIIVAYTINELADTVRDEMLGRLLQAGARGTVVLVIEPIARRLSPWWRGWTDAFVAAGGRADEWRVPADLPERQRTLARAAGLKARELTARSLLLSPSA